jgi:endogenous inhibitor of DNA gyrase (YacG/DUF329 family)
MTFPAAGQERFFPFRSARNRFDDLGRFANTEARLF